MILSLFVCIYGQLLLQIINSIVNNLIFHVVVVPHISSKKKPQPYCVLGRPTKKSLVSYSILVAWIVRSHLNPIVCTVYSLSLMVSFSLSLPRYFCVCIESIVRFFNVDNQKNRKQINDEVNNNNNNIPQNSAKTKLKYKQTKHLALCIFTNEKTIGIKQIYNFQFSHIQFIGNKFLNPFFEHIVVGWLVDVQTDYINFYSLIFTGYQ